MYAARLTAVATVLALLSLLPACGTKKTAVDQSSPKAACASALKGLLRLDKDAVLQCSTGTDEEMDALETFLDFVIAGRDFREAFIDAYGTEAWDQFQDEDGAHMNVSVEGDPDEVDAKLDEFNFHVEGDTCTATYQGESLQLTRKNGKWYLHASALTEVDPAQVPTLRAVTRVVRKYEDKIGERGMTGERLDQEMGRELAEQLGGL